MRVDPYFYPTILLAALFYLAGAFAERNSKSIRLRIALLLLGLVISIPGLLYVTYYLHILDRAAWFYNLRAWPGTELLASGLGFGTGWLQAKMQLDSAGERIVLPLIAVGLLLVPYLKPLLDAVDLDQLTERCDGDVCMQSTASTCGPASAATILHALGRSGSEREVASEAFTSRGGTENWYLARALRRRGLEAYARVQPSTSTDFPAPSIAGVVLRGGAGHFVAILEQSAGSVTLADPLKGKMVIEKSALGRYYRFTGFFLEIHPIAAPSSSLP